VDTDGVARAVAAVTSLAADLELPVNDVTTIQNSNKLALRLLPCDVFARVAPMGQEVVALELRLAQQLVAADAPVAAPEAMVEPFVYQRDGFSVTLWTYYETNSSDKLLPADYACALERLHAAMRDVDVSTPHFTDRIEEARRLVANHERTPALDATGRELLLDTLDSARQNIDRSGAVEQLLHGEPHSGNILNTTHGPLFIDLETCCRGPVEFDLAHVPGDVSEYYSEVDRDLLNECRRFVLAMVAAWRWDVYDQFPDGLRHGRAILDLLQRGPPWPTLGELGM
jgi:aminoglycoside phosphotransferase (APT) family kinase protein